MSGKKQNNKPHNTESQPVSPIANESPSSPIQTMEDGNNNNTCPSSCNTLITSLKSTIDLLINKVEKLEQKLSTYEDKIDCREFIASQDTETVGPSNKSDAFDKEAFEKWKFEIEELIESRTNRQLRKTLVFRNITENPNEKSWADTDNLLSKTIAKQLDMHKEDTYEMIDRCHRGGDKKYYDQEGKTRPIFAAMISWKDCEEIIEKFRTSNTRVMVDYKFGPRTTIRRNQALKRRIDLKSDGTIDQGYIQFPARLMGRKNGDAYYKLIEDFSSIPVTLTRRGAK